MARVFSEESLNELQDILANESKNFTLEEIQEISKDILEFFEIVADENDQASRLV